LQQILSELFILQFALERRKRRGVINQGYEAGEADQFDLNSALQQTLK
jgi:hypothetical protein